jgi:hypothetical protein
VGSNPTPSANSIDIIEQFGIFDSYAQSGVQTLWDDTDSIGLVVFVLVAAIIFVAALLSRCRKANRRRRAC